MISSLLVSVLFFQLFLVSFIMVLILLVWDSIVIAILVTFQKLTPQIFWSPKQARNYVNLDKQIYLKNFYCTKNLTHNKIDQPKMLTYCPVGFSPICCSPKHFSLIDFSPTELSHIGFSYISEIIAFFGNLVPSLNSTLQHKNLIICNKKKQDKNIKIRGKNK